MLSILSRLLSLLAGWLPLIYLVLDGHFGNHNALAMVRQSQLHLISKLCCDAALCFPYAAVPPPQRSRRKYGAKVQYHHLPEACLQQITKTCLKPASIKPLCYIGISASPSTW